MQLTMNIITLNLSWQTGTLIDYPHTLLTSLQHLIVVGHINKRRL